jgi:hypothetical protein
MLITGNSIFRLAICVAFAVTSSSALSMEPAPVTTDADVDQAEHHFEGLRAGPSLHTRDAFPDGAKGFIAPAPQEPGNTNIAVPVQFKSRADWSAQITYCNADAIVVAKLLSSTPILMSTQSAIYTLSRFAISKVVKTDGTLQAAENIVTYRLGGEVADTGELLRVDMPDAPPYRAGASYLLLLKRDNGARKMQYSTPDFGTISVRNGRVFSNFGTWSGFVSGTALTDVLATFSRVASVSCK